ncbi:MAG: DNA replication and repair protein RecF [Thermoleophilia bacterium]|nr:DNA replication and repair protein RecF [Thermoleophilia bacterium]
MWLRRLVLTNTRCRRALTIDLGPGLTVVVGPNGAGKTTVLEAISLLLRGTMLRPGNVRDLITAGEDYLRVEAEIVPGQEAGPAEGPPIVAAAAYSRTGDRRLTADGAVLSDWSRWTEVLPVRSFVPDDLRLIKGAPARRREFVDFLCERRDPGYRALLASYDQALAQRNCLLRLPRSQAGGEEFRPWEELLAQTGLALVQRRAAVLSSFVGTFQASYAALTGEPREAVRLVYRTNVGEWGEDEYHERLRMAREADRQRTFTHIGPHRDDFRVLRWGLDMRDYASQGEQRIALLALVLAEWGYGTGYGTTTTEVAKAEDVQAEDAQAAGQAPGAGAPAHNESHRFGLHPRPLLLLDDVMSELDEQRRRALLAAILGQGQAVITTTDLRYFAEEELAQATVVELSSSGLNGGPRA